MTDKIGFDFDEFGGNVDIVIVKADKTQLAIYEGFEQHQAWGVYNRSQSANPSPIRGIFH